MRKKKLVKRVTGIALTVGVVILAIVCVGKVNLIQNEKDIIGTWKDANAEEVFTFQDNGELAVSKDMPDPGLACGSASYSFPSSNMIWQQVLYALKDFLIKRLGSLLEHIT